VHVMHALSSVHMGVSRWDTVSDGVEDVLSCTFVYRLPRPWVGCKHTTEPRQSERGSAPR
jgi:hypothetical protein